jgi:PAS domain S-box-containing protein
MEPSSAVTFNDLFDIDEIQRLQDQFAKAFGVASVITTPEGVYITRPSNFTRLCQNIIRCTEKGLINCMRSDAVIGRHNPEGPIVQQCLSGGLWDAGASVTVGSKHIANWLVGQVRNLQYDEKQVIKYAREIGADLTEFVRAYIEIPSMSKDQFQLIADLLFTMAGQLSEKAYQNDQKAKLILEKSVMNKALAESEEKFRNLFEHSPVPKSFTGVDGSMLVNSAFCELLGYTKEELTENKFDKISHPDDVAKSKDAFQQLLDGVRDEVTFEQRYLHKNGAIIWAEVSAFLQRDVDGKPQYFITIAVDVTQRELVKQDLLESEARYNSFIDADTDLIFVKDENLKYLMGNNAMASFFGKTKEELLGKTDEELGEYSVIYPCVSSDRKVLETMSQVTVEEVLGNRIFEVIKFPIKLKKNRTGIGGILRDITDKKNAQEILNAERTLLRTLIDNLPVSIYVKDINCRKIVSNITDFEKLGFSSESEIIGKTDLDFFPYPEGLQSYNDDLMVVTCSKSIINKEESFPNKHGGRRWTLTSKIPLTDKSGKTIGLVGIGRDITEQKLANETILKLTKGIEQSPATIVITDLEGNIEYANPKFFEITGYSPEETIGANPRILKSGDMNSDSYKKLWETISSGEVWRGEFHNKKKNGELFWESATITSIKNEKGEVTNYIAIKEDISERKKMETDLIIAKERAVESDRLKSAFLANMSHEIRTPLNSIIGFSELLTYDDFGKEQKNEFIDQIVNNGNNLLNIINDIVDLSKIEAGEIIIRQTSIPCSEIVHEVDVLYRRKIESKGLEFRIKISEATLNCVVFADHDRLKQVFSNLLGNALKFTQQGYIEIGVRRLKKNLEFRVSDTGIGIATQHHTQVFDRFRQVEASYNRRFGGNGLGLAITKNLIELMGGRIWLESELGKGSSFFFTVPYKNQPEG